MDKKTKYKILGVFVALGLVVILLPFFQNSEEIPQATALITPPAFPDQAVQVPASTEQTAQASPVSEPAALATEATVNAQAEPLVAVNDAPTTHVSDSSAQPTKAAKEIAPHAAPVHAAKPAAHSKPKQSAVIKQAPTKKVAKTKTPSPSTPELLSYNRPMPPGPITDNGLFALKNPSWVVQIGSFNNKVNALKLVNQLRASGYRAFIQKVSTTFGENTRVFVGPERKPESARVLANQLESDLHLHGIVVSYKPLTL